MARKRRRSGHRIQRTGRVQIRGRFLIKRECGRFLVKRESRGIGGIGGMVGTEREGIGTKRRNGSLELGDTALQVFVVVAMFF